MNRKVLCNLISMLFNFLLANIKSGRLFVFHLGKMDISCDLTQDTFLELEIFDVVENGHFGSHRCESLCTLGHALMSMREKECLNWHPYSYIAHYFLWALVKSSVL